MQRRAFLLAAVLAVAVGLAYLPALRAGFIWNDDTYLTENPALEGWNGLRLSWVDPRANEQYYPLVFTTFWLEKSLWGLQPFGYHLVNVLLHIAAALLLWRLLERLGLPGAWFAAAVFALHPVCVESVAWVTERKNTLSLVLALLSALAYLGFEHAQALARTTTTKHKKTLQVPWHRRAGVLYVASFGLLVLALLAKTTASLLPPVLLVLVWWRSGRLRWPEVRPVLPLFLAGAALAWHTAWLERTMVRASGAEWSLGLLERVLLAGQTVTFYAAKLVWPANLAFIYPRWVVDPRALWQWLPVLAVLAAVVAAFGLRRRLGRGPLAALLLLCGVLFPAMGFFNVYAMRYSWVADHFAYQAVVVLATALVAGASTLVRRARPVVQRAAVAGGVAVLLLLGLLTFGHARVFRDEDTLWTATLLANPGCFMCHANLGHSLVSRGRVAEAIEHLEESLRLKPDNVPARLNLARVEEERGDLGGAAAHLEAALAVDPESPVVRVNLGTVYTKAGRYGEAVEQYQEALRRPSPNDYLAHNGLGVALIREGRVNEAIGHFRAAVHLRPGYAPARANLDRALAMVSVQR